MTKKDMIRTSEVSHCYLCNSTGKTIYKDLSDIFFRTPGDWNLSQCTNLECELVWLNPMPLQEDIHIAYQSYYTHDVKESENGINLKSLYKIIRNNSIYKFVQKSYLGNKYGYNLDSLSFWKKPFGFLVYLHLISKANIDFSIMCLTSNPGGHLLDVGCGNGDFLSKMQELKWIVQGIEIDEKAIIAARAKGLNVQCLTLEEANFEKNYFDVIVLSHVIEHVYDPESLLKQCYEILKPGGKIVITTPNFKSLGHKIYKGFWRGLEVPRHIMIFSENNLRNCSAKAGFKTEKLCTTERWAKPICSASRIIPQGRTKIISKIWAKIIGEIIQMTELILQRFSVECGEELYYIGVKEK
jgi:2-polyprenyl-3-methyl-5-hydroxy-6-metoxy-1,4-benzoquinol methylase